MNHTEEFDQRRLIWAKKPQFAGDRPNHSDFLLGLTTGTFKSINIQSPPSRFTDVSHICEPHQMRWRPFIPRVLYLRYAHTTTLKLRPYQETCLESCLDALKEGSTKIGVSLPTGAGKTVVFVSLLERLQPLFASPEATRSLVIVNSIELARQAADQARKLYPHWTVEIEQGARHTASGLADMCVSFFTT